MSAETNGIDGSGEEMRRAGLPRQDEMRVSVSACCSPACIALTTVAHRGPWGGAHARWGSPVTTFCFSSYFQRPRAHGSPLGPSQEQEAEERPHGEGARTDGGPQLGACTS
jgi:hypothetical protein